MASLGIKDGIFHIRFRFGGTEYKKSLKTRDPSAPTPLGTASN
jgi:hypothetical protein